MREILFRGKRADTGEWIYGDLRQDADLESAYIGGWDYFIADYALQREPFEYPVSPETVSQFTGLYDKNGVMIFENDIVYYDGSCYKVVFESRNGTGYFGIVVGENETWGFGNSTPAYMMTVVGNIHDNADLLEGENNAKEQ